MTPEQKAAYIMAMTVNAMADIMGMQAENEQRIHRGETMAYDHTQFLNVVDRYGISHNAVVSFFHD